MWWKWQFFPHSNLNVFSKRIKILNFNYENFNGKLKVLCFFGDEGWTMNAQDEWENLNFVIFRKWKKCPIKRIQIFKVFFKCLKYSFSHQYNYCWIHVIWRCIKNLNWSIELNPQSANRNQNIILQLQRKLISTYKKSSTISIIYDATKLPSFNPYFSNKQFSPEKKNCCVQLHSVAVNTRGQNTANNNNLTKFTDANNKQFFHTIQLS